MVLDSAYYDRFAAAYVRGEALRARQNGGRVRSLDKDIDGLPLAISDELLNAPLDTLSAEALMQLIEAGKSAGLKLYRFKNVHDELPRVKRALGYLRAIQPASLLDVGSGRGVFLWPCMREFPDLAVTSIDLLPRRVELLQTVALGGAVKLCAREADLCALDYPDASFDTVTLLEVLEHIPDVSAAIRSAVRVAQRNILVSVPSKPDNNPEHIHLLTKDILTTLFSEAGCSQLHFDGVNGHLLLFAIK